MKMAASNNSTNLICYRKMNVRCQIDLIKKLAEKPNYGTLTSAPYHLYSIFPI
jgi:hypothetical protein